MSHITEEQKKAIDSLSEFLAQSQLTMGDLFPVVMFVTTDMCAQLIGDWDEEVVNSMAAQFKSGVRIHCALKQEADNITIQ